MGNKYEITGMRNGMCPIKQYTKETGCFIKAVFYFIRANMQYKIVDLKVRRGYSDCRGCDSSYCFNRKG